MLKEGYKLEKQKNVIKSIRTLKKSREKVFKLFNDYSKIPSKAEYRSIYGEGLKILTPRQMLQRLPVAFAQLKADNRSENLLNEIRQIKYFFYRAK